MVARTLARAEDILLKILKFCLQNDAEAKTTINLEYCRSHRRQRECWLAFDEKKSSSSIAHGGTSALFQTLAHGDTGAFFFQIFGNYMLGNF